jgi:thiol-disulfide isomerase/thioredoxin
MSLYEDSTVVTNLDDGTFINKKIRQANFHGAGILKVYAPWCPFCISKVSYINSLGNMLKDYNLAVYVLDAEENPILSDRLEVTSYPTFLKVTQRGEVTDVLQDLTAITDYINSLIE